MHFIQPWSSFYNGGLTPLYALSKSKGTGMSDRPQDLCFPSKLDNLRARISGLYIYIYIYIIYIYYVCVYLITLNLWCILNVYFNSLEAKEHDLINSITSSFYSISNWSFKLLPSPRYSETTCFKSFTVGAPRVATILISEVTNNSWLRNKASLNNLLFVVCAWGALVFQGLWTIIRLYRSSLIGPRVLLVWTKRHHKDVKSYSKVWVEQHTPNHKCPI